MTNGNLILLCDHRICLIHVTLVPAVNDYGSPFASYLPFEQLLWKMNQVEQKKFDQCLPLMHHFLFLLLY
uniref:Uncharacterized protein n=1 Tax=Arundo donax TaxID=35708 RepID=A0A0A9FP63_ARUDO